MLSNNFAKIMFTHVLFSEIFLWVLVFQSTNGSNYAVIKLYVTDDSFENFFKQFGGVNKQV